MWTSEDYSMYIDDTDTVMVTDPCYCRSDWNTSEQRELESGLYRLIVDFDNNRVKAATLIHQEYMDMVDELSEEYEDSIGVDAGMAGFFMNKPDFNDSMDHWREFLEEYVNDRGPYYRCRWGLFTDTYDGDGQYELYALWDGNYKVGLKIYYV